MPGPPPFIARQQSFLDDCISPYGPTLRTFGSVLQSHIYSFNVRHVNISKAFALICCVFSLFVQVAAHAAAVPQSDPVYMDCAEMAQAMPQHQVSDQDMPSNQEGCCPDMTLECLVSMNCLPPLLPAGSTSHEPSALRFAPIYLPIAADPLESQLPLLESPPPQSSFSA